MKVSIVVPVYNAGEYVDMRAGSLLGQTMPAADYEIIYVNDGSTDDSAERLERIAAQHTNVHVHHQENSGWPGKPRNVGVQMARGEYVQFVDQDDELAPDALERLHAFGTANGADIVFGKSYGGKQGPVPLFKLPRERCTAADADLFDTLTPHKMFRRQFLLDNDIRFPEGRVRLEDQLFLARAYPRAKVVSVLADRPTYHWHAREDGGNNSNQATNPKVYFGFLRQVVQEIKSNTEPGALQDRMLTRSLRLEVLRTVSEPRIFRRSAAGRRRLMDILQPLVREEFPPSVAAGLPSIFQMRAHLLEAGDLDGLLELARRLETLRIRVAYGEPSWRGGALHLPLRITLHKRGGAPLTLVRDGDRLLLDPELLAGITLLEGWTVTDPLRGTWGNVMLRDADRFVWWFAPPDLAPRVEPLDQDRSQFVVESEVVLDTDTLADGRPLDNGRYFLWLTVTFMGLRRRQRLALPPPNRPRLRDSALGASRTLAVGKPARVLHSHWSRRGFLRLDLAPMPADLRPHRALALRAAADDRTHRQAQRLGRLARRVLRRS